jgi:hypothetical protein
MIFLVSLIKRVIELGFDAAQLTGPLMKAGRALAGWTAEELSSATKLGLATIKRAEACPGATSLTAANADRVVEAFSARGVEFFADSQGLGVRLRSHIPPA